MDFHLRKQGRKWLSLPKKAKRTAHSEDANEDSICKQSPVVKIFMVKC